MPKTKPLDLHYYNYAYAWYISFDSEMDDVGIIKQQLTDVRKNKTNVHTLAESLESISVSLNNDGDVLSQFRFMVNADDLIMYETESCIIVRKLEYDMDSYSEDELNNPLKHLSELSVLVFADKLTVKTMNNVYNYLASTLVMSEF